MFGLFGNEQEVSKLRERVSALERRVSELEGCVTPPGAWNLREAIYGRKSNQPGLRSTWGLWQRLSALEKCVFGHDGNIEPKKRSAVYAALNELENVNNKKDVKTLQERVKQLEEQNEDFRKCINNLEKSLIKAVNEQLEGIK